jgi:hypothetical protein
MAIAALSMSKDTSHVEKAHGRGDSTAFLLSAGNGLAEPIKRDRGLRRDVDVAYGGCRRLRPAHER